MSQSAAHTAGKSHHHVMPLKIYLAVGVALLIFTMITVEVAKHDFGSMNIVIALVIATIKAILVAFFFMHLWYDNKLFFIAFSIGVFTLAVFIALTMADTMERGQINPETMGQISPRAEMYSAPGFGQPGHGAAESAAAHDSIAAADTAGTVPDTTTAATADTTANTTGDTDTAGADKDSVDQPGTSH
jgi:cytochrome c oxidase subunit 4